MLFTCAHFRRVPEVVLPCSWWERCSADPWSCPGGPWDTQHLPRANSWSGTWRRSWSNSHPCSRPNPGPNSRTNPRANSRTDSRTISRTDSRTVSRTNSRTIPRTIAHTASTRCGPTCVCVSSHVHTHTIMSSEWKCTIIIVIHHKWYFLVKFSSLCFSFICLVASLSLGDIYSPCMQKMLFLASSNGSQSSSKYVYYIFIISTFLHIFSI